MLWYLDLDIPRFLRHNIGCVVRNYSNCIVLWFEAMLIASTFLGSASL